MKHSGAQHHPACDPAYDLGVIVATELGREAVAVVCDSRSFGGAWRSTDWSAARRHLALCILAVRYGTTRRWPQRVRQALRDSVARHLPRLRSISGTAAPAA